LGVNHFRLSSTVHRDSLLGSPLMPNIALLSELLIRSVLKAKPNH